MGYGADMQGGYYDGGNYGGVDGTSGNGGYGGMGGPSTPVKVDDRYILYNLVERASYNGSYRSVNDSKMYEGTRRGFHNLRHKDL